MTARSALVCDDDRTLGIIVSRALSKKGFAVRTAEDGAAGLEAIRAEAPELLVLDLDMPVKGGLAVLEELRAGGTRLRYVIVLSAHESPETHAQVRGLGADETMVKPFTPVDFMKRIDVLLAEGKL